MRKWCLKHKAWCTAHNCQHLQLLWFTTHACLKFISMLTFSSSGIREVFEAEANWLQPQPIYTSCKDASKINNIFLGLQRILNCIKKYSCQQSANWLVPIEICTITCWNAALEDEGNLYISIKKNKKNPPIRANCSELHGGDFVG